MATGRGVVAGIWEPGAWRSRISRHAKKSEWLCVKRGYLYATIWMALNSSSCEGVRARITLRLCEASSKTHGWQLENGGDQSETGSCSCGTSKACAVQLRFAAQAGVLSWSGRGGSSENSNTGRAHG